MADAGPPALIGGKKKMGVNVRPARLGLTIPLLSVISKVDKREDIAKGWLPGQLRYGQISMESARVVFLKADEVRRYDVKASGGRNRTLCASGNGIMPLEEVAQPPSRSCDNCMFAPWSDGEIDPATGQPKRIPPDCSPGIALLGLLLDRSDAPFWLVFMGKSELIAKGFLKEFAVDPGSQGLWQVVTTVTAVKRAGSPWYDAALTVDWGGERLEFARYLPAFEHVRDIVYVPFLSRDAQEGREPARGGAAPPPDREAPPPLDDDDIPF